VANILIGIFIGFFARGIYNKFMVSRAEVTLFKEIEYHCLQLLILSYEDFVYLKERKIKMMEGMKLPENDIKVARNVDQQNITKWQDTAISKFLLAIPPRFRPLVKYRNWKGAMSYLNKFLKKT